MSALIVTVWLDIHFASSRETARVFLLVFARQADVWCERRFFSFGIDSDLELK